MRKTYLFMMISLDGYFEGANHDISWHHVDTEFVDFAISQLDASGTLVFGARTYALMADFWPSDYALKTDPETAIRMNNMQKIVFSGKLEHADWNNTELSKNVKQKFKSLKAKTGKDIAVFGSSDLCVTLLNEKLLDELRIMINPVVLGRGTPLFHGLKHKVELEKTDYRMFESGNILMIYKVIYTDKASS